MAICDYLALKRYFFWRSNNIPVFSNDRYRAMPKYAKNGVPDILLIKDGTFYGLEVKRPQGGVQSSTQREFQEGLEKVGGKYYLVSSIDDVQSIGL